MFLVLLEIRVNNDPILDTLDIYFINDICKEVVSESIGLIYIQSFIAFVHICDIAINKIENELTDIQFWFYFLDLIWQYADKVPKDCPYVLTVLQFSVDILILYGSITKKLIIACRPKTNSL